MILPPTYHFTSAESACAALEQGVMPAVTPGDSLQVAGVWVSPNVYGFGSPGSQFGPIGLRIRAEFLAQFRLAYIGLKPRSANRHRFLMLRNGEPLPGETSELPAPAGYPHAERSCEILLLGAVPAESIDGIVFGNERDVSSAASQLEHRRLFAYLLATESPLLAGTQNPHSTQGAPYSGWWVFDHLRCWLAGAALKHGAKTDAKDVKDALFALATGEEQRRNV